VKEIKNFDSCCGHTTFVYVGTVLSISANALIKIQMKNDVRNHCAFSLAVSLAPQLGISSMKSRLIFWCTTSFYTNSILYYLWKNKLTC